VPGRNTCPPRARPVRCESLVRAQPPHLRCRAPPDRCSGAPFRAWCLETSVMGFPPDSGDCRARRILNQANEEDLVAGSIIWGTENEALEGSALSPHGRRWSLLRREWRKVSGREAGCNAGSRFGAPVAAMAVSSTRFLIFDRCAAGPSGRRSTHRARHHLHGQWRGESVAASFGGAG